jgi:hypothetical protein
MSSIQYRTATESDPQKRKQADTRLYQSTLLELHQSVLVCLYVRRHCYCCSQKAHSREPSTFYQAHLCNPL